MSHCASLPPPPPAPPPSSLPFTLLFSLFHSHSFHLSLCVTSSPPSLSLSLFSVCLSPSVERGAVLNRGLFVHKHASSWPLPYLLVSRAAVALLCVTAQPCLFSLPGSCLSWLWTSFKACPVSAPHQTHTHAHTSTHTNTLKNVYTLPLQLYSPAKEHTQHRCGLVTNAHKNICTHTVIVVHLCLFLSGLSLLCKNVFKCESGKAVTTEI